MKTLNTSKGKKNIFFGYRHKFSKKENRRHQKLGEVMSEWGLTVTGQPKNTLWINL